MKAIVREVKSKGVDTSKWSGIWVFAEQDRSGIKKVTLELLTKARDLAKDRNTHVAALLFGDGSGAFSELLFRHGAEKIYLIEDSALYPFSLDYFSSLIVRTVRKYRPEILMIGATRNGRVLAPSIAARLGTGLTADCTDLSIDSKGLLKQIRPAFGGNIMASILCTGTRPQMASVRPNVMDCMEVEDWQRGEIIPLESNVVSLENRVQRLSFMEAEIDEIDIEDAEIVVCGGFGVGSSENFRLIKKLAEAIGAAVGCTRKVVDEGWVSHEHQVGQTGKTIRPKLYIACGVSGAIQHQMGMNRSDKVLAINSDPQAPIFSIADYGIVGDLFEILPLLRDRIQKLIRKV